MENHAILTTIIYILLTTHLTILSVTLFLHRAQSHSSLEMSKPLSHLFRFWLWFATGQVTKEWVAIHRKHHAKCETEEDPHSPKIKGIWNIVFKGVYYYRLEAKNE
jgi:stearoyl-CoA desaturase (Delta-9 desaturase)